MRNDYGCEDSISIVEDRDVRHCNWVRFLQTSDDIDSTNIVGVKVKGEVVFQTVKTILPNEEIVAYLQRADDNIVAENVINKQTTPDMRRGKY